MWNPLNAEVNGLTKMASLQWKSSGTQTLLRSPDYGLVYCYFMGVLPEFPW